MQRASGEGSFSGDPERYVKKGSGYVHLSPKGPLYVQGEPAIRRGAHIPRILNDGGLLEWGISLRGDSMKGT